MIEVGLLRVWQNPTWQNRVDRCVFDRMRSWQNQSWQNAYLTESDLTESDLTECVVDRIRLDRMRSWQNQIWQNAYLTESELTESDLTESDLTEFLLDRFFVVFLAVENSSGAFDSMPNKPTPFPLGVIDVLTSTVTQLSMYLMRSNFRLLWNVKCTNASQYGEYMSVVHCTLYNEHCTLISAVSWQQMWLESRIDGFCGSVHL